MMKRMIPDYGAWMIGGIAFTGLIYLLIGMLIRSIHMGKSIEFILILVVCILFYLVMIGIGLCDVFKIIKRSIQFLTPIRSIKTMGQIVADTLSECKIIAPGAYVETKESNIFKQGVIIRLMNATLQDQEVFSNAMQELLGPKVVAVRPLVMPSSTAHSMAL